MERRLFYKPIVAGIVIMMAIPILSINSDTYFAEGFLSQSTAGWVYELSPGQSQVGTWTLTNTEDTPIIIEFRAEKQGSEFFIFEKLTTLEAKEKRSFEFIVSIPDDHPDNIEYRPILYALEKAIPDPEGGAQVLINYQMSAKPIIKIGDNPVFTPEEKPDVVEEPEPVKEERPDDEDFSVSEPVVETIEEKLERIQKANEANQIDEILENDESNVPEPMAETLTNDQQENQGGGCLIATAAYGTELAPQVQFLREVRDNTVMSTSSGAVFMTGFNQLYYSFSPTIADWQRENPLFKEAVKLSITPMISSLTIMTKAYNGSEMRCLG